MPTANYAQLAHSIRLANREIGRRAGVSATTVAKVLADKGEPFYSKQTAEKIHKVIDDEAKALQQSLNRLMGN